jgi:hypothetical protein
LHHSLTTDFKCWTACRYDKFTSISTRVSGHTTLVLVSADRAKIQQWCHAVAEVNQHVTVGKIMFDEAHILFTGSDLLKNLYELRVLPEPLVLLSGSVPVVSEEALMDMFGLLDYGMTITIGHKL